MTGLFGADNYYVEKWFSGSPDVEKTSFQPPLVLVLFLVESLVSLSNETLSNPVFTKKKKILQKLVTSLRCVVHNR